MIGQKFLDEIYDPAATPTMAAVARSIVRFNARMLVVRYAAVTGNEVTPEYTEGLFEKSEQDIQSLGSFLASISNSTQQSRFPAIDLRLESLKYKLNRWHLRRAVR
jgi:hypothetical protein